MQIRCPHCQNAVEIVDGDPLSEIACPSCGSSFHLISGDATQTYDRSEPRTIAHFELTQCLGQGQMGSVWKSRDTKLDRTVAVKIPRKEQLAPGDIEQFLREARAAAQISHPNIVPVHEVGREGDTVYIVSDYVEGLTLADWLTGRKQISVEEAARLSAQIADALHHAHEAGVIHRDLKPSNIMLDADGQPHVMDFGLAKREAGEITMTVEGKILGTPAYMSPEQARGEGHDADRRTDVYSLGVILYELLTGDRPFHGNVRMLLHQVLHDDPPSPRKVNKGVPRDLETICLKCLEKRPPDRYASAADFASDLRRYLDQRPILARRITLPERAWRWGRRNPLAAGLSMACLALLFAVAGLVVAISSRKPAPRESGEVPSTAEAAVDVVDTSQESDESQFDESNLLKRLVEAFDPISRDGIGNDEDAVAFYQRVIGPLRSDADRLAENIINARTGGFARSVLEDFFAEVGYLVWENRDAKWPFAKMPGDVAAEVERLFGKAIDLSEYQTNERRTLQAAHYYRIRSEARLELGEPDVDGARADAERVLKLSVRFPDASGTLSSVSLLESRHASGLLERLESLDVTIKEAEQAVQNAPSDEPLLATWLSNLGTAYVERASFTRDPSLQKQKADLNRAIVHATRATNMENTYPDYPYLILGNAHEDLAWLVREDIEDNYKNAIENFRTAARNETDNPAMALHSLGRCYYKIVADSYVDTSEWKSGDLKGLNAEQVMIEAEKLLTSATQNKPDLADAFLFLWRVQVWLGKKEEAAKSYERYKSQIVITSPEARDANARLTQISSLVFQKKYVEALSEISLALPEDLTEAEPEDAWTLQQSVRCRIGQLDKDGWSWATATKALQEAEFAVNLAYTPKDLSESLYLRARVHHAIAAQVVTPRDDTPDRFRGTALSQFSDGLSDYRDAFRLVPFPKPSMVTHLGSPTETAERRYFSLNLLLGKAATIRSNPDIAGALSPEDRQRYIEELREGIRWADEFLLLAGDNPQNKNYGTQAKVVFEEELKKLSQILEAAPEPE